MLSAQTKKPLHPSSVHRVVVVVQMSRRKSSKGFLKSRQILLLFKQKKRSRRPRSHRLSYAPSRLRRASSASIAFLNPFLRSLALEPGRNDIFAVGFGRHAALNRTHSTASVSDGTSLSTASKRGVKRRVERGDEETRNGSLAFAVGARRTCARVDESRVE